MKKYITPEVEVVRLNATDVVSASLGDSEFDDIEW